MNPLFAAEMPLSFFQPIQLWDHNARATLALVARNNRK